jgi:choline kinase
VTVVVGHREQEFRECLEGVEFVRSERYAETNTAVSLLAGLSAGDRGALWLNTDVAFDRGFAQAVVAAVLAGAGSFVSVRRGRTADEEVKYLLDDSGAVCALSKQVARGRGEAIGVNHVSAADRETLRRALAVRADSDYFEAAVEATIGTGTRWMPLDLTDHFAVEVDFPEDLAVARAFVAGERLPSAALAV